MSYKELADLIFPNVEKIDYFENKYPERKLIEGAQVTRFAPSPTGFVHLGSLFTSLVCEKIARQTDGIFYIRIEDTDQKREVENAVVGIVNSLKNFGIIPDEGQINDSDEIGNYGPYKQSKRKDIYQAYAKHLIEQGLAYPCFCSQEDLNEIRQKQENAKYRTGYYGKWAKCRNMPIEEAIRRINNEDSYIIRFKSNGDENRKIKHSDIIKGSIEFPENDQDIVIIKSDGLPTYHFAHIIDDHLMHTTIVIRGDEWVSSIPLHLQLFKALSFKIPKYAHVAPIMKEENSGKRKLSKRKDVEAAVEYYHEQGIPKEAVYEYLLNIASSNFEEWRKANKDKDLKDFNLQLNKMSVSGALFDFTKMLDISKNIISKYTAEKIYDESLNWAKIYDNELLDILSNNKEYAISLFNIERGKEKPRKDIAKWSDIKDIIIYMYEDKFYNKVEYVFQNIQDKKEISKLLSTYIEKYFKINNDKQDWFDKIKDLSEEFGYAREVKEYKKEPEKYKGHVGDVSTVIRIVLTGRQNTPDLYEIMQILGENKIKQRINKFIELK